VKYRNQCLTSLILVQTSLYKIEKYYIKQSNWIINNMTNSLLEHRIMEETDPLSETLLRKVQKLPPFLGKEIFEYLLPDLNKISFELHRQRGYEDHYNIKYKEAFINGRRLENRSANLYLSRIDKKNGKHRYYFTEVFVDEIEVEYYDRPTILRCYEYKSTYVGKDLKMAILLLQIDTI
jgi:hypothetical protein